MRARNIKPGFFKNEYLAECDPLARLLFAGLWGAADREGRLEYRPMRLKAEILPYDDCNIEALINQLLRRGFIIIYKNNGVNYLSISTFKEHQHCNIREPESTIPAPDEAGSCTEPEYPLTEYPLLNTPYPILKTTKLRSVKCKNGFEIFWSAYPKKRSKGDAEKVFSRINPDEQLLAKMCATIEQAKTLEDWTKEGGKYIPYPATWLNAKSWEDDLEPQKQERPRYVTI